MCGRPLLTGAFYFIACGIAISCYLRSLGSDHNITTFCSRGQECFNLLGEIKRWGTVCLYEDYVSPKNGQARNQWQNCRIGKPSAKKWFFLPDHVGLGPEVKEKLGEIRSLLETLGGTLWVQNFFYLY